MAMGTKLVAGNWKMNGLRADGAALARALVERIAPAGADVRGLGPMLALELPGQEPARATAVAAAAFGQGLVLLTCGLYGNVLRLHVPFVIEDGDLERGLEILERSLDGNTSA